MYWVNGRLCILHSQYTVCITHIILSGFIHLPIIRRSDRVQFNQKLVEFEFETIKQIKNETIEKHNATNVYVLYTLKLTNASSLAHKIKPISIPIHIKR